MSMGKLVSSSATADAHTSDEVHCVLVGLKVSYSSVRMGKQKAYLMLC